MSTVTRSGSWSGNDQGSFWGLTRHIGPWKSTPADIRRANSRGSNAHAGHGNWMQTFDGKPYIQTKHTPGNSYFYGGDSLDVVTSAHYVKPRKGQRIPMNRASGGGRGINGVRFMEGEDGVGPQKDKWPEDQKRGFGVGVPEEETIIKAHIDQAWPPRVVTVQKENIPPRIQDGFSKPKRRLSEGTVYALGKHGTSDEISREGRPVKASKVITQNQIDSAFAKKKRPKPKIQKRERHDLGLEDLAAVVPKSLGKHSAIGNRSREGRPVKSARVLLDQGQISAAFMKKPKKTMRPLEGRGNAGKMRPVHTGRGIPRFT